MGDPLIKEEGVKMAEDTQLKISDAKTQMMHGDVRVLDTVFAALDGAPFDALEDEDEADLDRIRNIMLNLRHRMRKRLNPFEPDLPKDCPEDEPQGE